MRFTRSLAPALALSLSALAGAACRAQNAPLYSPGELLVGLRPASFGPAPASALAQDPSVSRVVRTNDALGVARITVANGFTLEAAAARLRARPDVAFVERNLIRHATSVPNDTSYSLQWGPHIMQAEQAWDIWKPQKTVIVAIVDTGIDYNHPDLTNKILRSNGAVVGYNPTGANAVSGSPTDTLDDHGHGTHCAGIAAAQSNNGLGIAGIAGWTGASGLTDTTDIKLMPVKVMDSTGSATVDDEANGITWAVDHGAKVINLSLGSFDSSTTESNAIDYAWNHGCVIVAAAGNEATAQVEYPAGYWDVLSVGSTDKTDTLSSFSNYGDSVACAAPGEDIYSTLPTYSVPATPRNYGYDSGTSMSTPHAAGEAALVMSAYPWLSNSQVLQIMRRNVDPIKPYLGVTISANGGRLNAYRALKTGAASGFIMDFDQDGQGDLIAQNPTTRQLAVLLLHGNTVAQSYSLSPSLPAGWLVGGTGDFLGNHTTSIAVQNLSTQQISILGVSGHNVVSSTPLTPPMLPNWQIVAAGDFNGDGQPDLVAQNTVTRDVSVLTIKNLKITASISLKPTLPAGWKVVGARDFDGNGTTDLLVQNTNTQQLAVLFMNGTTLSSSSSLSPNLPAGWQVMGASDLDFSGKPRILAQNLSTRQISVLTLNGLKITGSAPVTPTLPAGWALVGPK